MLGPAEMVDRAVTLHEHGDSEEALRVYEEVVRRFGDGANSEYRVNVALALANKAGQLYEMGRLDDSIAAYGVVRARLLGASDDELREQFARSMFHLAQTLGEVGRSDEAIATCDELVGICARDVAPRVRVRVAKARQLKATILRDAGRGRDALTVLERDLIPSIGGADDGELREQAALAFYNRAVIQDELDQKAAARAYDDFLRRFKNMTSNPTVTGWLAAAHERRRQLEGSGN